MAFIGTLRNKMGTWVVVFVFVAIAAFILGDLFSGQSSIFSMNDTTVGEIAGHSISLEEFQQAVREREANYIMNFNREPSDREMPSLRQQAWDLLILRYAIQPQFRKVGVEVTPDEIWDMIQGKNVDENVKMAFTNQETGQFDRDRVVNYLNQLKTMPENSEPRVRWEMFQRDLLPGRERIKYENLLVKTNYITSAEAEREYHLQTDVAEVKYLYVPFFADTTTAVSDAEMSDYYNKNKEKFKTEDSRSFTYVVFPLIPSSSDTLDIRKKADEIAVDLAKTEEDSLFAVGATDGQNAFGKYTISTLPPFVNQADLQQGKIVGPFIDGGSYKILKVVKVSSDTIFNAKASHILIRAEGETDDAKKAAKEKARGILKDIKAGASFAAKAQEFGTDGTKDRGGDLGWFASGQMVKPFESAVFAATKPGLINDVVETDFGYHIIDVTGVKTNTAYTLAVVELNITPSDATTNEAYRNAETFSIDLSGVDEFKERAKKQNLATSDANNVVASDRRIGTLGESREIVRWLFNDASEGKVSTVFDLQDSYVIGVMTSGVKKGYKPLDAVKEEIKPMVQNQVRGKAIVQKLSTQTGTLEEMAASFAANANVYTSSDLKLGSNTLPSAGNEPQAVGVVFSLENGKRSKPFIGETGVFVIELQNKTIAPSVADYSAYKSQIEQRTQNMSSFNIAEAIKNNSGIEDERYKFY